MIVRMSQQLHGQGCVCARLETSQAPGLPCGSYEGETTNLHGLSGTRPSRAKPVFYLLNMDTQDRQDKQQERLRHRKQTRSMIGWVLEVIQEPGSGFWEIRVGTEAMVELMTVETLAK